MFVGLCGEGFVCISTVCLWACVVRALYAYCMFVLLCGEGFVCISTVCLCVCVVRALYA